MRGTGITYKAVAVCTSLALLGSPIAAIADEIVLEGNGDAADVQTVDGEAENQQDTQADTTNDVITEEAPSEDPQLQCAPTGDGKQTVLGKAPTQDQQNKAQSEDLQKKEPVTYVDQDGNTQTIDNYELLEVSKKPKLTDEWYVYPSRDTRTQVTFSRRVEIQGNVNIIIGKNVILDMRRGIHLPEGSKLTIWSVEGRNPSGMLVVSYNDTDGNAGIGGNAGENGGEFVVASGKATVSGTFNGAGIGGGKGGNGGPVTVCCGTIDVINYEGMGAAIGGGENGNAGKVTVGARGTITASADGTGYGAGIGGGFHGNGGQISVDGGQIIAVGGRGSAALGGGRFKDNDRSDSGKGGKGGNVYVSDSGKLDLTSSDGGSAAGAGAGAGKMGKLTYFGDYCVTKDGTPVEAADREQVVQGSDAHVTVERCEHADFAYKPKGKDSHEKYCKFCDRSFGTEPHEFGDDNVCDDCGYKKKEKTIAQVAYHTLNLEGKIGINTYVVFDKSAHVDKHGKEYLIEFYDPQGKLYSVSSPGGASEGIKPALPKEIILNGVKCTAYVCDITAVAKDIPTQFTMKIKHIKKGYLDFANNDGTVIDGNKGLDYGIMDYLDSVIVKSKDPKMIALAKDMKNYGIYAKHYFNERSGTEEPLPVIEDFVKIDPSDLGVIFKEPQKINHFAYVSSSLNMIEETTFRLYFTSDDVSKLTIKVKRDGKIEFLKPQKHSSGKYFVEVPGIPASKLDDMYRFEVSNGEETVSFEHGPYGYAYVVLSDTTRKMSQSLRYLVMAMYHYSQSADAYFNNK